MHMVGTSADVKNVACSACGSGLPATRLEFQRSVALEIPQRWWRYLLWLRQVTQYTLRGGPASNDGRCPRILLVIAWT